MGRQGNPGANEHAHVMAHGTQYVDTVDKRKPETPAGRALRNAMVSVLEGRAVELSAAEHGLPIALLRTALANYERAGWEAVEGAERSHTTALRRKLTEEQERQVHVIIRDNTPDEVGQKTRTWNKEAVHELVLERTGHALPPRTLATYMERWGFAPEKPLRSLFHEHPAAMREWMRKDYPVIAMQAREDHGVLHWWGSVPLLARERSKARTSGVDGGTYTSLWPPRTYMLMFATTNRGHLNWMVHRGAPSESDLLDFLSRLFDEHDRKHYLLVDDDPLFASPLFIEWSLRNKDRFAFHLLPIKRSANTRMIDARS